MGENINFLEVVEGCPTLTVKTKYPKTYLSYASSSSSITHFYDQDLTINLTTDLTLSDAASFSWKVFDYKTKC